MMKPKYLYAVVLILSACAPLKIYHKPGVTVSRMQDDMLACEVRALKDAPVATQVRRAPPEYIPSYRYCRSDGSCYRRGGYFLPGEVYTVDVNASLRNRLETQCMAKQGYQRTEIPNCKGTNSQSATPSPSDVLPVLTPNSCVIRNRSGGWQIIDANG